jgi:hypothetical protein
MIGGRFNRINPQYCKDTAPMSRSGYSDDIDDIDDQWRHIRWRGQVASAIRGKRGQAFLRELIESLDAVPEKRLIADELIVTPADTYGPPTRDAYYRGREHPIEPGVCAIGSVGIKRGINLEALNVDDYDAIAGAFGIAHQLVREIEFMNDDYSYGGQTPEQRWQRVRNWAASNLRDTP